MNKRIIDITKLVVLIFILILLVMIFGNILKGGLSTMRYGKADCIFSKEYEGVKKVTCDMASCSVRVTEYDGEKVQVKAYSGGFPKMDAPKVSMEGGTLSIRQRDILHVGLFIHNAVEVLVPRENAMDYDLHTSSGSLKLDAKSNTALLNATSGSVKVYQGGKTLDVKCVSGSVRVYAPFVSENINCSSGSIKAMGGEISESININCTSGSVRVMLDPGDLGYSFKADATSGSIRDEYRDARFDRSGSTAFGDQKLAINVHTTSGSIRLEDWND